MRRILLLPVMLLAAASGRGQVSGYASAGYGFHSNPLSNFEMTSDNLLQGYWLLDCLASSPAADWKIGYVGGLMIFQNLAARNYYEHRITAGTTLRFPRAGEEQEGDDTPFRGSSLALGARLGARHDRADYRQFDSWGADLSGTYTWGEGTSASTTLSDETGLRRYASVSELDNLTSVVSLRLTVGSPGGTRISFFGGGGIKHYLTSEVDTSVFTTVSSSSSSNGQGKGKGKGLLSGTGNGKKDLLVNASSVNTLQLHIGVGLASQWEGGSVQSQVLYRIDPGSSTRVLAQYANSTMLSEDLYNDFFSHDGPEVSLALRQSLPLGLNLSLDAVAQRKKYLSPAFSLDGVQTAADRVDLHGGVELSFSRYTELGGGVGMDIGIAGGLLRNLSNDAYNDYSGHHYSLTLGMGF
jgi:hypothetical protein